MLPLPFAVPALATALSLVGCKADEKAGPELTITPVDLDFAAVPVDGSETATVALQNTGGTDIALLSLTLDDGDPGVWNLSWGGSTTLSPGEEALVEVTFAPEEEGGQSGLVLLRTDLDDPQRQIALSGTATASIADADEDGFSVADGDCDDGRPDVYPGAEELCDGRDNDCDEEIPADEADADGDGYRECDGDCDDAEASVNPGAEEACDGVDTDCDGIVQDDRDDDGDGYSLCTGDCDDDEARAHPGGTEVCDYVDNDCSGGVDDLDADGDGFSECESGGDCDDADADSTPVLVDETAGDGGDGSVEAPFNDLASAVAALDPACPTVVLRAGSYTAELTWTGGDLSLVGADEDPDAVVLSTPEDSTAQLVDISGGGTLTLRHLMVSGVAAAEDGGAIRAEGATVVADQVHFSANTSTAGDGGAIAVSSGALRLTDCTFSENSASDDGGAVAALSSSVQDHGSIYLSNQGARGGAVVWEASTGTLADGVLQANLASVDGGGLWLVGGTDLLLERLDVWENRASGRGGGLTLSDLTDDDSVLRNLWVEANEAGGDGGGIAVTGSRSSFVLHNSDLLGNRTGGNAGGLWLGATDATGTWAWSNIVAFNEDDGIVAVDGGGASVAFNQGYLNESGTQFDLGSGEDGGDNEIGDPRLASWSASAVPEDQDLALQTSSPARDSGPNAFDWADAGGPSSVSTWRDLDDSDNDRGITGGPGATP